MVLFIQVEIIKKAAHEPLVTRTPTRITRNCPCLEVKCQHLLIQGPPEKLQNLKNARLCYGLQFLLQFSGQKKKEQYI